MFCTLKDSSCLVVIFVFATEIEWKLYIKNVNDFLSFPVSGQSREIILWRFVYVVPYSPLIPCANLLLYISDICCDFKSVFLMNY